MTATQNANPGVNGARWGTWRFIVGALVFALLFCYAYVLSTHFFLRPQMVFTAWLANGVILGFLLLSRVRTWPLYLVVGVVLQLTILRWSLALPLAFSTGMAAASLTGPVLAGVLIRRLVGRRFDLRRLSHVGALVMGGVIGEGLTALMGLLWLRHYASGIMLGQLWQSWLFAFLLGVILVTPVIVGWGELALRAVWRPSRREIIEASALMVSVVVLDAFVFGGTSGRSESVFDYPYLVVVPILVGALRCHPRVPALMWLITGVIGAWATAGARGPFASELPSGSGGALDMQVFLAVAVMATLVIAAVISERREAEAVLVQREQRFRTLSENTQEIIVRFDRSFILLYANRGVRDIFLKLSEGCEGKSLGQLGMEPTLISLFEAALDKVFLTGEENRLGYIDSDDRLFDWVLIPEKSSDGKVQSVVASGRDISHLREEEEQRLIEEERRQRLVRLESIAQLSGGFAHEFNNYLTAIIGNSELLEDELPEGARGTEVLDQIQTAAQRAAKRTSHMLLLSQRQLIRPHRLELGSFFQSRRTRIRYELGRAVSFVLEHAEESSVVLADEGQLEMLVDAIVENAREAMPGEGTLKVTLENVTLDETSDEGVIELEPGRYARVSFEDTGCGIDEVLISRIFEPYETTKTGLSGAGLGLALVYAIVRQNKAWITVSSAVGRGTTFVLYWPLADNPV